MFCFKNNILKGSTSNLITHLKTHKSEFEEYEKQKLAISQRTLTLAKKRLKLDESSIFGSPNSLCVTATTKYGYNSKIQNER